MSNGQDVSAMIVKINNDHMRVNTYYIYGALPCLAKFIKYNLPNNHIEEL